MPTCEKALERACPPDDDQCGTTERNSLESWAFGSSTSMQALQTEALSSPAVGDASVESLASHLENGMDEIFHERSAHAKSELRPFELSIGNRL